jgi:hypothetical protein
MQAERREIHIESRIPRQRLALEIFTAVKNQFKVSGQRI